MRGGEGKTLGKGQKAKQQKATGEMAKGDRQEAEHKRQTPKCQKAKGQKARGKTTVDSGKLRVTQRAANSNHRLLFSRAVHGSDQTLLVRSGRVGSGRVGSEGFQTKLSRVGSGRVSPVSDPTRPNP